MSMFGIFLASPFNFITFYQSFLFKVTKVISRKVTQFNQLHQFTFTRGFLEIVFFNLHEWLLCKKLSDYQIQIFSAHFVYNSPKNYLPGFWRTPHFNFFFKPRHFCQFLIFFLICRSLCEQYLLVGIFFITLGPRKRPQSLQQWSNFFSATWDCM